MQATADQHSPDFADIKGHPLVIHAMEVMVTGWHHTLIHGPRGSGKSMFARRLASISPEGMPVRMPHHTCSLTGMLGGHSGRSGEVDLAARGVLVLTEVSEYSRSCIDGVAGVLEVEAFTLLAANNDCPCGWAGNSERVCTDSPSAIRRHMERARPIIDAVDIGVRVESMSRNELLATGYGDPSAHILERVVGARAKQAARFGDLDSRNGGIQLATAALEHLCPLDDEASAIVGAFPSDGMLRAWRVARTIQDLDPASKWDDQISAASLRQALELRMLPVLGE